MDLFSLLSPEEDGQKEAKKRRTEVMAMGIAEEDDGANAEDERGEAEDTYSEQAPYFGRTSWHKTSTGATSSGTAGDRWSPASLAAMPKVGIAARVAARAAQQLTLWLPGGRLHVYKHVHVYALLSDVMLDEARWSPT